MWVEEERGEQGSKAVRATGRGVAHWETKVGGMRGLHALGYKHTRDGRNEEGHGYHVRGDTVAMSG